MWSSRHATRTRPKFGLDGSWLTVVITLSSAPGLESRVTKSNQLAPSAELSAFTLSVDVVRENWRNEYTNTWSLGSYTTLTSPLARPDVVPGITCSFQCWPPSWE